MSYTESLLASGERIVRRSRQHWFVMVWNARWAVVSIIAAIVLFVVLFATNSTGTLFTVLSYVGFALLVIGLLVFLWGLMKYRNEEYVLTTRRVIHVEGVINKKTTDSSLEKINDAVLTESIFGRIFGFGDLEVLTASEAGIERLRMLRDAKDFKKAMIETKHELELELTRPTMPPIRTSEAPAAPVAPAPTPAPAPAPPMVSPADEAPAVAPAEAASTAAAEPGAAMTSDEVATALDHLADLRERGLVTPEEFDAKRRELLDRL